jgi:hypothetical protein
VKTFTIWSPGVNPPKPVCRPAGLRVTLCQMLTVSMVVIARSVPCPGAGWRGFRVGRGSRGSRAG